MVEELIKDKIEIFLISETKLDNSFPNGQFLIKGYSTPFTLPFRTVEAYYFM